jgi:poly(beta-D-mannuronate) lyase
MKKLYLVLMTVLCGSLHAATINVSTVAQLTTAINNLAPGDIIIMANGTYSHSGLTVDVVASSTYPVTIKAQTVGGVHWRGYLRVYNSTYVTVDGIVFDQPANASSTQNVYLYNSDHCRFTRCTFDFDETGLTKADLRYWLVVEAGSYNAIDYCLFNDKITKYPSIKVIYNEYHPNIHHNYFNGRTSSGGLNGYETIQLGSGSAGCKMESMGATVDYNLFAACDGEAEYISSKTSGNRFSFNTFYECAGQLTLRMADNCEVYNNYFLNPSLKAGVGGVRIHGNYNEVYNNYFDRLTEEAIETRFGDTDTTLGTEELLYRQSKENLIAFNTMFNCRNNVLDFGTVLTGYTLPPKDWDIRNNLFVIYTTKMIDGTGDVGTFYENNIADEIGISGISDMGRTLNSDQMWIVYHNLTLYTDGIYRQLSTALGRSQATPLTFLSYLKDLDHESRDSTPDIGADEYRSTAPAYHPLTAANVGPSAY